MLVKVRLFAIVKQQVGQSLISLELPEGATVGDLKSRLAADYPMLAPLLPTLMIAVSSQYAREEDAIPTDAEIAVIPPVSGGLMSCERCHD